MGGFSKTLEGRHYSTRGLIARRRYRRHPKTLKRWQDNPAVGFPPPDLEINGIEYWLDSTLDAFDDRQRAAARPANKQRARE
jgi:hypothetical protein